VRSASPASRIDPHTFPYPRPYSPKLVEDEFSDVRLLEVLGELGTRGTVFAASNSKFTENSSLYGLLWSVYGHGERTGQRKGTIGVFRALFLLTPLKPLKK
jgi:hypothetical protein